MIFRFFLLGAFVCFHVITGEVDNLILRIQNQISVDMSSQWADFHPSYAVDGNEETLPDDCHCCAGTTNTPPYWWRLNLGREYIIKTIIFIGRNDTPSAQSRNFSVYKGFSNSTEAQTLLYKNTARSGYTFTKDLDPPVKLQRLEVNAPRTLAICELKLVDYGCPDGQFGDPCEQCGKCKTSSICNKTTGVCPYGCQPGYRGNLCNTECDLGTFGQNCLSVCHCQSNANCDHENGTCPNDRCAPGWKGFDCNTECDDGAFGQDCQGECHCLNQAACNKVNGTCLSGICANGWRGTTCNTECYNGTFGRNCRSICHCQNNKSCNHVDGSCPDNLCAPGWKETNCNTECDEGTFGQNCESACHCQDPEACDKISGSCLFGICAKGWSGTRCDTECHAGSFGQNCSSVCHCLANATCDHTNGVCPNGSCASGWTGIDCSTVADKQTMDASSTTGVITGIVIAVVVLAGLVTVGIIYWRRKRNQNDTDLGSHHLSTSEKLREDHNVEHAYTNTTVVYEKNTTVDETEHIYDGITSTDDSLPIKELWNVMKMAFANGFIKLYEEFQAMYLNELQRNPKSARSAKKKDTKKPACKESRIQLTEDGRPVLTLMDAQYVYGYGGLKKFITTQGLSSETVNELWEMVYQENASLIVMLEGPSERKKNLCVQYWPSEGKVIYGRITIKKVKFTTYSDYTIRKFVISKQNTEQRQITQMQFTGWPDDNVPDNAWQFVQFWSKSSMVAEKVRGPVFVHSYTPSSVGSYIALDSLCRQAQTDGLIHPKDTMKDLFKQCGDLIQTKEQYGFIYEALAEALHVRAKSIRLKDFEEIFISMSKQDRDSGKSGLAKQYDIMFQTDTMYTDLNQRTSDHLYSDLTTSTETKQKGNIPAASKTSRRPSNTMMLKNYIQQEAFILTTFDESFGEEIWMMIETRKMKTVIRFQSDKEDRAMGQPAVQESHSKFSIQLLESNRDNNIIINSYAYMRKESIKAEVKTVKEFVYVGWHADELLPTDVQSLIAFICTVQQWQPAVNENHPVLLCCKSNVKKTELCFPLLNEFDRIRSTGEVNLLETVKYMAEKDERLILSFAQYEFCHAVVLEYIKNYDVYENVC